MAVSEYEDVALRYAGSLPDGTDVEYTHLHLPHSIVAAEQHWATRKEVDALRERIAHLERLEHKRQNCRHCTDDYGDEVNTPETVEEWAAHAMRWLYEMSKVMTLDDIGRLGSNRAGGIRAVLESYPGAFVPEPSR